MNLPRARMRLLLALAFCGTGFSPPVAARPGGVPLIDAYDPNHPYVAALDGLGNYQGCGARARAAQVSALAREFGSIEASAMAKGLGPLIDRLRRNRDRRLSVSSMVACTRGPVAARAAARRAMAAFRAWVAGVPAR